MYSTDDGLEQLEGHGWDDLSACGREYEEELISLDEGELDTLPFLNTHTCQISHAQLGHRWLQTH